MIRQKGTINLSPFPPGFDKGVIMKFTKLSKEDLLELEEQGLHSEINKFAKVIENTL